MSHYYSTLLPDGLKRFKSERQSLRYEPPIPFAVPPRPEEMSSEHTVKVRITKHISETASVFCGGIKEAYLIYLSDCQALLRKKEMFARWKGWDNERSAAVSDLELLYIESEDLNSGSPENSVDESTTNEAKILAERISRKQDLENKRDNAVKKMKEVMAEDFLLYELLLSEDLRKNWVQCVSKICDGPVWTDENGTVHNEPHGRTWDSLERSTREWLLCQFPQDAAEQQRHYLSHYVVCPQCMKIPNFVSRMEQLNGYIAYLPCRKDSTTVATSTTERMNHSFHENELAGIILNCFPTKYENQYYLNNGTVPSEVGPLRDKLMQIEKVIGNLPLADRDKAATKNLVVVPNDLPKRSPKMAPRGKKALPAMVRNIVPCVRSTVVLSVCTIPRIVLSMILMAI